MSMGNMAGATASGIGGGSTSAKQSINTSTAAGWAAIYWILSIIFISILFFNA